MKVLYLVHNLADPAVARRVAMLRMGGAEVDLVGFRRADASLPDLKLANVVELGVTHDARMLHRLLATLQARSGAPVWARQLPRPDVIVARNLEMLAIANRLRTVWDEAPALAYECLDLHRLILRQDRVGRALRAVERRLMAPVRLLLTSSPAFLTQHFDAQDAPPALLVENKVFAPGHGEVGRNPALDGHFEPLRIGWFGALRCEKSLVALSRLSSALGGKVEVELRGRPALTAFRDFHAGVQSAPHLHFGGGYRYPDDLPGLYSSVHFVWAIDFFEEGQNSAWLLPNRLYEGCLNGAIPVALAGTETAAFIERLGIGIVLEDIAPHTLLDVFGNLTGERVRAMAEAVAAINPSRFRCEAAECGALAGRLGAIAGVPADLEVAA
ncbi:glycosyl transferase family 1 [Devosia sp. PTR5]|uniref:Glycosyl transferase family 1 n=1 Tax=Devosia oryzisoli TaxID=2774138 RepID=A0A927ISY0_9HYPH|nr:glycosyl transferase family 1 [Devosia oryzisoli]